MVPHGPSCPHSLFTHAFGFGVGCSGCKQIVIRITSSSSYRTTLCDTRYEADATVNTQIGQVKETVQPCDISQHVSSVAQTITRRARKPGKISTNYNRSTCDSFRAVCLSRMRLEIVRISFRRRLASGVRVWRVAAAGMASRRSAKRVAMDKVKHHNNAP